MPTEDTAQVEIRTEEVTRTDLRTGTDPAGAGAELTDATGFREVSAFLEVELKAADTRERQAELGWALGRVLADRLGDLAGAATAWRVAFERDSRFGPAASALRHHYWSRGNWSGVLETLEAELRAGGQPEVRAETALLMGRVYEEQLCNPEAARRSYEMALDLAPGHRTAIAFLTALEERHRDPERLTKAYERAAQASTDRVERSLLLEAAARLHEERARRLQSDAPAEPAGAPPPAGDEAAAMQLDALALREDPTNAAARRALKRLYHKHARWAELVEVLLTEADLAASDPARVVAYALAARVLSERLHQRDRALDIYRRALALAPDDPLVLSELADLCQVLGRWDEAQAALERLARGALTDSRLRATVHLRAGRIAIERLGDDERALAHYSRAVELDPRCGPALAALGRLHARRGDWPELARLHVAEAELAADSFARAAHFYKAGEIVLGRIGDAEQACDLMARALRAEPGFLPAVVTLERLYRALGRFAELAELYQAELSRAKDEERRAELLELLAEVHGSHTGDLSRAAEELAALRKLGAQPTGGRAMRAMLGVLERSARWKEVAQATAELAQQARDPRQAATLWHRAAEVWEEHVGDVDEAAACHRRALEAAPTFVPSLQALGRLGADVIKSIEREIEITAVPEARAALYYRLGELHEGEGGGGVEPALAAYQAALAAVAGYAPAAAALERLYRARGESSRLVEVIMAAADAALDPVEKATALYRAGQVLEENLHDIDGAADVYARALAIVPDHAFSLEALERLYAQADRWTELADVRRRAAMAAVDDAARIGAWGALGDLLWARLGDAEGAISAYQKALAVDPHDAAALRQLERLSLELSRWEGLVEVYERLASRADEPEAQVALWRRAAAVRESREREADPTGLYERVLEASPHDRAALEALDRLYTNRGEWRELSRVLYAQLDVAPDVRVRVTTLVRMAEANEMAGQADDALACAERAAEADPASVPAVRDLRRLREQAGDAGGTAAALEREAAACRDPRTRVQALSHAATIALARFRDDERAAACLRRAIEIAPHDEDVGARLEQLYARLNQWERAAELLEKRAAAADEDRVPLLLRLAEVYRDRLEKPAAAVDVLRRVVASEPNHLASLVALGDLHAQTSAWPEAVAAYGRAAAIGDDPAVLRQVHLKLGDIWAERLGDPRRAISCFQNVLAPGEDSTPEATVALERLAQIFIGSRDWPSAAAALERLISTETDLARAVEHELRLAEVYASGYGDPTAAIAVYKRALERDPSSAQAARGLEEACARASAFVQLATALEASAAALPKESTQLRAERRIRAAEIQMDPLGKPEESARLLRAVLAETPDHLEARARLGAVLGRRLGRTDDAVREHRAVLQSDPVRADAWRELRRLWERAGDHDRALWATQALRLLRVADELEERYLRERRNRAPKEPQGALPSAMFDRAVVHPGEQHPGRALLAALAETIARMYPGRLEDWGLTRTDRLQRLDDPVRTLVDGLARTIGVDIEYDIYVSRSRLKEVDVESGEPPVLIVGGGFMATVPAPEQRFLLGRALARLITRSFAVRRLTPLDLEVMLAGAVKLVVPKFGANVAPEDTLADIGRRMQRALPRRSRRVFEEAAEAYAAARPPRADAWLRAMDHTANRAGLLLANDLVAAVDLVRRGERRAQVLKTPEDLAAALRQNPDVVELLKFALSDDFFALRRAVGLMAT
jgi:tetratricopeptide (TPR) repeat protein